GHEGDVVDGEAQAANVGFRGYHSSARADRPRKIQMVQGPKELYRSRQWSNLVRESEIMVGVPRAEVGDGLGINLTPEFAQQLVGEEAAAHADLAVDPPHRQVD